MAQAHPSVSLTNLAFIYLAFRANSVRFTYPIADVLRGFCLLPC
jgi:hypothetical protein